MYHRSLFVAKPRKQVADASPHGGRLRGGSQFVVGATDRWNNECVVVPLLRLKAKHHAYGQKLLGNCALCPRTTEIVERIPNLTTAGFSWLEPGTHIKPHVGYSEAVYLSHLGLVVPKDCWLRVGPETRTWQEGKVLVFDDTTEHEVRNNSDGQRVVLLMDFKRGDADFDMVNRDRAMVLGKLLRMKNQMALSD
jgi:aspartyl/asparaginyl beta-hydroxylase (cupin superfamily)